MDELNERADPVPNDAQLRIKEVSRLFVSIRDDLDQMVRAIGASEGDVPQAAIAKLMELKAAHLMVSAAEEAFDAQQGKPVGFDELDFEAIRAEIGSQLDRLRAAILADKLPFDTDPCAACRAALSL